VTEAQARIFAALRAADHAWVEMWELARACGFGIRKTACNVRELRYAGIVVTRRHQGLSRVEVSLAQSGLGGFTVHEPPSRSRTAPM
jgi:hypothetical protein